MKKIIGFSIVCLFFLSFLPAFAQEGEHGGHGGVENFCHDPTRSIVIGTAAEGKKFNVTQVNVEKGECVTIMFVNTQDAEHDFALHFANGTEYFGLHIIGNGTAQMKMVNALMPNEDTVMPYWCTVEDHKDQGMTGEIIVGNGLAGGEERSPGFGLFATLLSSFVLAMVFKKKRR